VQPIEAADYHDLALPSEARIAPDGDHIAFVRTVPTDDETSEATVYVVSTAGSEPRRFTVAEGTDSEPRWSPSGDRLAFVSTRGADDERPQLWVMPTTGGEGRQVTDVAGGVSNVAWGPDGDRMAFVQEASAQDRDENRDCDAPEAFDPDEPDPRVIDRTVYRSAQRYFDGRRPHIYVVDLGDDTPGERPVDDASGDDEVRRLTDGDADFESPAWGDAETLYYARRVDEDPDDSIEYEILVHDLASDDVETVHRTTGWSASLAATADGRVAHVSEDPDRSTLKPSELQVYDGEHDRVTTPTAPLDRTLADVTPQWGPDDESLYVGTPDRGTVPVWRLPWDDEANGDPERVVDAAHVSGAHVHDGGVAVVQSDWDYPGDVFYADESGDVRRLTRLNETCLDDRSVAEPEAVRFDSENPGPEPTTVTGESTGEEGAVQGWVLTPPDIGESGEDETCPLVVEVHGGPHAMWSTAGTMWHEFQTLAARGYAVFWCNPRGSTGYGEAFAAAIEDNWGPVTTADVLAGVDTVVERESVDGDQLFLTGGSFGGYTTAWLVGHSDEFTAAVSQRGVYDLTGFYGSTDAAYRLVEDDFGTTPWADPDRLREASPAAYCDRVQTPTLVLHSDDDYRTPANTAELFHRGLRKHGVDTRMVRYPREGHELSRSGEPGHVVDRIERIVRWFDGYSEYRDVPRALDRPGDAGLSAGADEESDGSENDRDGES
jgi:dipeptidyl aminopeptidase/acylaminoacyl peptidase